MRDVQQSLALGRRYAEQQEMPDTGVEVPRDRFKRRGGPVSGRIAEPNDRIASRHPFDDEERLHELRDGERRLRQHVTQMCCLAQAKARPGRARCSYEVTF